MTREELIELIAKRLIENADRPGLAVSVLPVHAGSMDGMRVSAIPLDSGSRTGLPPNASIGIVDDRAPDVSGPGSFNHVMLELMLRTASLVAVDSAEPVADLYHYFMDRVASGNRLVIVQTTEERQGVWREFLRLKWQGSQIAEVVPVKNDPTKNARAFITNFGRNR